MPATAPPSAESVAVRMGRYGLPALLALTAAVYLPALRCGFVWDDISLVVGNRALDGWGQLGRVFASDLWSTSAVPDRVSGYYRPLQLVSLMLDRTLWGATAGGYHLQSVAWHLAATAALFAVLKALVRLPAALLGAAFFALHPLQVETAVWVSARSGSMATALGLAGVAVLLPAAASPRQLAAGALLMCAALLSKEHAIVAPLLLAMLGRARASGATVGRPVAAALAGVAVGLVLRLAVGVGFGGGGAGPGLNTGGHSLMGALATVGGVTGWELAVPWPLTTRRHLAWSPIAPGTLLAGWAFVIVGCAAALRAGGRLAATGLVFALLAFAPSVLAILDQGLFGDRYLYLPLAGVALAVAAAADRVGARAWWAALAAIPALAAVGARIPDWDSDLALDRAAALAEDNPYAWGAYGGRLAAAGETEEGLRWLERSLAVPTPPFASCHGFVRVPLEAGDRARAARHLRIAQQAGCAPTESLRALEQLIASPAE